MISGMNALVFGIGHLSNYCLQYFLFVLAHLSIAHVSLCRGAASGVRLSNSSLNIFFSRTTKPISTKLAWGWGFKFVQIKGLAPFGAQ